MIATDGNTVRLILGSKVAPYSFTDRAAAKLFLRWATNQIVSAKGEATAKPPGKLALKPPQRDGDKRLKAPKPEWGNVSWQLPPSYREFIARHSRLQAKWGNTESHGEFIVLDPKEIRTTSGIVYMPKDVAYDQGAAITTNHLVPFASAGDEECAFWFDVSNSSRDGEYPVYYHHQDQPRARYQANGTWVGNAGNAKPDFANFGAWLAWLARELLAGHTPPQLPRS